MVATVGSISIDLSTNAAKFATGFRSAATTVDRESARMSKAVAGFGAASRTASGVLSGFVGGIVAGGALAALTSLGGALGKAREALSDFEAIANEARVTGLKTDMFQAISFGALEADVSQEKLNAGLEIFAKNVGLAQEGTGKLYSGLKTLNPELLRAVLSTNDQGERLKLVADAMRDTTDATQKAALATTVFGKGGIEMIRVLDGGRKAIDDFNKRAADLGLIIPDDLLQKSGELDDKLEVLSKVVDVNLNQALVNLAPLIVSATEGMANFAKEINDISKALTDFSTNPSNESFTEFLSKLTGLTIIPGSFADNVRKALVDLGKTFDDATTNTSDESTKAIAANIQYLEDLLADLKRAADEGQDVKLETDDATAKLHALQTELAATQAAGVSAANAISAGFAQAFREAENASMVALAAMNAASGSVLPTVHRYGGDPNAPIAPTGGFRTQQDVNGSGVNVIKPILDETAGSTRETADNVSQLDTNTRSYLQSLSSDIGQYSAQQIQAQNVTINRLSDLTAETFGMLPQAIVAALAAQNDSGTSSSSSGGYMFGDAFDPRYGSYISSRGIQTRRPLGTYNLGSSSSDGTSETSVQVAQPGTNITLNYQAAAGESERTARQRAREMYDELLLQASRA